MLNETDEYEEGEDLVFLPNGKESYSTSVATAVCFSVIFFLSVSGNTLVLCILAFYENLRHTSNLFILNLAVSDLVFASTLPFWTTYHLSHWVFGDVLCKLLSGAYFVGQYSSLMFLTVMTVDRYVTVLHGSPGVLRKWRVCARVSCVAVWVVSILASVLDMVFSEAREDSQGRWECETVSGSPANHQVVYYLQISLLFLLPLCIIAFCYSRILKVTMRRIARKKHKTVMVILCIVVAFFVCWMPYNLLLLLEVVYSGDNSVMVRLDTAFTFCHILAYSHCCLNPLLYSFTQKFRGHLSRLLLRYPLRRTAGGDRQSTAHSVSNIIQNAVVMPDNLSMSGPGHGARS
ncbi:chemokine XC receptor 1-like [Megalops cyprinoides]|uniref:chemokine XC receptor 1-like n=1 Tax=Megalops cyprinoides TaxID=118141 RepID=UPI0018652393|nr:chemokine XC receptor 1-like [Megalops cyprinoides]